MVTLQPWIMKSIASMSLYVEATQIGRTDTVTQHCTMQLVKIILKFVKCLFGQVPM